MNGPTCCDDACNVQLINCTPLLASLELDMPDEFAVTGSPAVGPSGDIGVTWQPVPTHYFLGNLGILPGDPTFVQIPFTALSGICAPSQGGVPPGGTTGQVLAKNSNTDEDTGWITSTSVLPPAIPNSFLTANGLGSPTWFGHTAALLPAGGSMGTFLTKNSGTDYDAGWFGTVAALMPSGGSTNQVLAKTSGSNYAVAWTTLTSVGGIPTGGLVGQMLVKTGAPDFSTTWEDTNYAEQSISPSMNTSSVSSLMAGFGLQLTIKKSGMVLLNLNGYVSNDTATNYYEWTFRYGTGAPPSPNDPATGSQKGTLQISTASANNELNLGNSSIVIPSLVWGTTYWFDITKRVSGGNGTFHNPTLQATEF